jgi:hypothetical protein
MDDMRGRLGMATNCAASAGDHDLDPEGQLRIDTGGRRADTVECRPDHALKLTLTGRR